MTLSQLNALSNSQAEEELLKCCGSKAWARAMARRRPFAGLDSLRQAAGEIWWRLDPEDWMEAFRAHPRIGQRASMVDTSPQTRDWSAEEQSGMNRAGVGLTTALEEANQEYFSKFGYIFIVCASGKRAEEMLATLRSRLTNSPEHELRAAAEEQNKITRLRLEKLLAS